MNGRLRCPQCSKSFRYQCVHAGFSDQDFFYCNSCGRVAVIEWYGSRYKPFYEKYISGSRYSARREDVRRFERDKRAMLLEIVKQLRPCPCDGRFVLGGIPKCPHCRKAIPWSKVVCEFDATSTVPKYFSRFVKDGWRNTTYYFVFSGRTAQEPWKPSASPN